MSEKSPTKKRLYEYVVYLHPEKSGEETQVIVQLTQVMAASDNEVVAMAYRKIPEDKLDQFDRLEVAVRPF